MTDSEEALALLELAQRHNGLQEWARGRACAAAAIEADPHLKAAYIARAQASRLLGDLDGAIEDIGKVIEMDPQDATGWRGRGACRAQKAAAMKDRTGAGKLLEEVHSDYQKASELDPRDEWAGLNLLELEICLGKYREAVGTTGLWWNRIERGPNKLICAWLGAVALVLAGRPQAKWAHFREYLDGSTDVITPNHWMTEEIDAHLGSAETKTHADPQRLATAAGIHQAFLRHYSRG